MNVLDCINGRRSIRKYTSEIIDEQTMKNLLSLGTKAATGSNQQPWGFLVIQDKDEIQRLSDETKKYLLENLSLYPYLEQYRDWLLNKSYSVFNNASTLLVIYGNTESHWHVYDCTLCAGNIMLAAQSMGIGTCWIGFAEHTLNTPEFKKAYAIPEHYALVCPMSMGYFKTGLPTAQRNEPTIFTWKKNR